MPTESTGKPYGPCGQNKTIMHSIPIPFSQLRMISTEGEGHWPKPVHTCNLSHPKKIHKTTSGKNIRFWYPHCMSFHGWPTSGCLRSPFGRTATCSQSVFERQWTRASRKLKSEALKVGSWRFPALNVSPPKKPKVSATL